MYRYLILVTFIFHAAGCATKSPEVTASPPSPVIVPFSNTQEWMIKEDMIYELGSTGKKIIIPAGFVTDFASVPQIFWGILSPIDTYSRAAIIHDYLYWSQFCSKPQSDNILKIAMIESNVPDWKQFLVYTAVQRKGQGSWDDNKKYKNLGYVRMVPKVDIPLNELRRPEPNETWHAYRDYLFKMRVKENLIPINSEICELGNQKTVPK